jgi:hypothetical protein
VHVPAIPLDAGQENGNLLAGDVAMTGSGT